MSKELIALHHTGTWDLMPLPLGKVSISCHWIYKTNTYFDGIIECYKARLVSCSSTQEYGINYEETFAPVAKMTFVRAIIPIATPRRWPL